METNQIETTTESPASSDESQITETSNLPSDGPDLSDSEIEAKGDDNFDFSSMAFDSNDEPLPAPEPAEEPVEQQEVAEAQPEPEPEPAEAEPVAEKSEPEPEPTPEPVKLPTREELQGLYTEHREKTLPELEKMFQLSEEQVALLNESPEKILPQLAAQMQYDAMMSSFNATMAALPSVVNRIMSLQTETQSAEQSFFNEWPELQKPEYTQAVRQAVQAFRTANPNADLNTTIKAAGRLAMMNLGLDPAPKAPETPKPKVQPARPAGAGSSAQPMPKPKADPNAEDNVFAALTEAFQKEYS